MLTDNDDTQELNMQCVLAVHEHRIPELVLNLERRGISVVEEEIRSRAALWSDAWRVYDTAKTNCFLCKALRISQEDLCICFNVVRVKQYHDPHDVPHITNLAPDVLIETYQCKKCANLAHIKARHVSAQHRKRGFYRTPRLCMDCYEAIQMVERAKFHTATAVQIDWQSTDVSVTRNMQGI